MSNMPIQDQNWLFVPFEDITDQAVADYGNIAWIISLIPPLKDYMASLLPVDSSLKINADSSDLLVREDNGLYINESSGAVVLQYQMRDTFDKANLGNGIIPRIVKTVIVDATNATVLEGLIDSMYKNLDLFNKDEVWSDVRIKGDAISFRGKTITIPVKDLEYITGEFFDNVTDWGSFCREFNELLDSNRDDLIADASGITYGPLRNDLGTILRTAREVVSEWYHSQMFPEQKHLTEKAGGLRPRLDLVPVKESYDSTTLENIIVDSIIPQGQTSLPFLYLSQVEAISEIINKVREKGFRALSEYIWEAELFAKDKYQHRQRHVTDINRWYSVYGGDNGWYARFLTSLHEAHERVSKEHALVKERLDFGIPPKESDFYIDPRTTMFQGWYEFPYLKSFEFRDVAGFLSEASHWFAPYMPNNLTNPLNVARRAWEGGITDPEVYRKMGSTVIKIDQPYRGELRFTPEAHGTILLELKLHIGNIYSEGTVHDPLKVN